MVRWTVVGSVGGLVLAVGVHAAIGTGTPERGSVEPELTRSGLRSAKAAVPAGPIDPALRIRTSGVPCILTSSVRRLPASVELRVGGQQRRLRVHNGMMRSGQAVGEIVVPYALLDGVGWRLADLVVTTAEGASASLDFDRDTGSCVATLPVDPGVEAVDVRCAVRGGADAPAVRSMFLWDRDLLPASWEPASAVADGDAFMVYDVSSIGTAELDVGMDAELQLRWTDGVCAEVSVHPDAELCVRVPDGDLLYGDPSYRLFIDDAPALLDGEGVGCVLTRQGESLVTQVWMTETSAREQSELVEVKTAGRQDVDVGFHPLDTASGALFWPSPEGPRVVSVRGLAEAAGVLDGDTLLAVDGRSVDGIPMADALAPLDGWASSVVLTLDRSDVVFDLTILFDEGDDAMEASDTGL